MLDFMTGVIVLLVVLAVSIVAGLLWRWRDGRVGEPVSAQNGRDLSAVLTGLEVDPGGADLTLVQFSSAFCAPCRVARHILARAAETTPGLRHVEVDAESHLDQVRTLSIMSTPTTLAVNRDGRELTRIVGQPKLADVRALAARVG
jgi:thiol-disulfide isomerase/thioredoxin